MKYNIHGRFITEPFNTGTNFWLVSIGLDDGLVPSWHHSIILTCILMHMSYKA